MSSFSTVVVCSVNFSGIYRLSVIIIIFFFAICQLPEGLHSDPTSSVATTIKNTLRIHVNQQKSPYVKLYPFERRFECPKETLPIYSKERQITHISDR